MTSLSPAQVSAPSTPPPMTPVHMPRAHPRANVRFRSRLLPHTLTCATHASLSQGHIGARILAAKPQDGSRQRIDYYYDRLRQSRDSRAARRSGRVGRCGPRTRPCESRPRARSLAARSAVQRPPLPPPPRPRLPWPRARPPSPSPDPLALRSARPCDRARPACRPGYGARWGQLLEHSRCYILARRDRASGGTLGGGHEGSVQPSQGGLRARVTSRESSRALGPTGQNRTSSLVEV